MSRCAQVFETTHNHLRKYANIHPPTAGMTPSKGDNQTWTAWITTSKDAYQADEV